MARKSRKPERPGKKIASSKTGSESGGEIVKPGKKATRKRPGDQGMARHSGKRGSPKDKTDGQAPLAQPQTDHAESKPDGQMPSSQTPADAPPVVIRVAKPVSRLTGEPLSELFKRGYVSPPNPDPDWGRGRAARMDDEAATATVPRRYKAPILRVPGQDRVSMALAAFRLGRLGIAMTASAETLWDDLVRRECGNLSHFGAFTLIPSAAYQLLEARRALVDVIPPHIYDRLERIVDQFTEFNRRTIEQHKKGEFVPLTFDGGSPPWEVSSLELATTSSQALGKDHWLRLFFDLGAAFGEFSVLTNNFYSSQLNDDSDDDSPRPEAVENSEDAGSRLDAHVRNSSSNPGAESQEPDPFPEIGKMTKLASSLPAKLLGNSKLLKSLAGIAGDYERIGEEEAFQRYFKENRDCWMDSSRKRASNQTAEELHPRLERFPLECRGPFSCNCEHRLRGQSDFLYKQAGTALEHDELDEDDLRRIEQSQIRLVEADLAKIINPEHQRNLSQNHTGGRLGEEIVASTESIEDSKIYWHDRLGILYMNGRELCGFSTKAHNIRAILNAFEAEHWNVKKCQDPVERMFKEKFPNSIYANSQAHSAINKLNKKTEGLITFEFKSGFVLLNRKANVK
jgi:hypothetical protein